MSSGADLLKFLDQEQAINVAREGEYRRVDKETQAKANIIRKVVEKSANPSPIILAVAVLIVLVGAYVLYMMYVKPCASGRWVDDSGVEYELEHNKLDGKINLTVYKKQREVDQMAGKIIDNYITVASVPGVWDYADNIMLFNGTMMKRFN